MESHMLKTSYFYISSTFINILICIKLITLEQKIQTKTFSF